MDYLLKASGLVIIFFVFYYLFLRNETFFKSIRIYFLIGLIIAVSIPLIEIPVYVEAASKQISNLNFGEITATQIIEKSTDWQQIFKITYLIGVAIFSFKFLIQLISLGFLLSIHQPIKKGKYFYVETSKNISPFSFFNIIIYNKSHFSIDEVEQIINHEKAHVLQWHSIDTILTHLLVITLWFNPFVWLYKKVLQQNLEFLADAYALQKSNDEKLYQITLLKVCNSSYCPQITNNFYNSLIKKRIIMLHKNQSENKNQWKYALIIPVLITFVAAFNTKTIAQEKLEWVVENETVDLIIDKNTTDSYLTEKSANFKNEFNIALSFKGIKRNSSNEITSIKIEAKGENLKAKFENSGTEAIKPIKISYNSGSNSVSIGNQGNVHNNHYEYTIHESGDVEFNGTSNKDGNNVFVTSDGEVNTWTSKSVNDSIIHNEHVIVKNNGDNELVWVRKNDENGNINVEVIELNGGKKLIKVIESDELNSTKEYNIEINEEAKDGSKNVFIIKKDGNKTVEIKEDNASENVYIIEKDNNGSVEKKVIKTKIISSDSKEKPLIISNGKEISTEEMEKINPSDIESVNVIKGENAIKKYGDKGNNGVIEITKKQ